MDNFLMLLFVTIIFGGGYSINIMVFGNSIHVKNSIETNTIYQDNKKLFTLKEAFKTKNMVEYFNGTWISDTEFHYFGPNDALNIYNVETGEHKELVSETILMEWRGGTMKLSADRKKLLIAYDQEEIFRHSTIAKYDVYNIEKDDVYKVAKEKKLQSCTLSPLSDRVVYVLENNVYIDYLNGTERKLTETGETGIIYNGIPDWVYEEEVLQSGSAIWFSPNGQNLAIGVFNDTEVKTYSYVVYGEQNDNDYQYPKELHLKYPKPGTKNPKVQLKIINMNNNTSKWIILDAPISTVSKDHILQSVTWSSNENLIVMWLNRRQNIASIQNCNMTGKCREIIKLEEPNGWIMASNLKCLSNGKNCIFKNWIDDWYQIWNLDLEKGKNIWNSLGSNISVINIYGYKESTDELFYLATLPTDMNQYHVFKNKECLSCAIKDADGNKCKYTTASFSKNFSYFALNCQGPTTAPLSKIFETKTQKEINGWELNNKIRLILKHKRIPIVKIMKIPLDNGNYAQVKLVLPEEVNLNETIPTKKYPIIVNVYGGPNSVRVTNAFSIGWDVYMVTNHNLIYVYIDGRGTGNKGKRILYDVNNRLGKYEVEDILKTVKILEKMYPIIDSERTGIWGWSYGGYVSAMTLAKDRDRIFQCGISVAPVTSWLYYDTIYTERYMGLPILGDNLFNYISSSVTNDVTNFRQHDFLLIHGTGDDNVHYQQSMQLAKVLEHNDILFEQMSYPDEDHSIGFASKHLYDTMESFWINCLNLSENM